MWCCAGLTTDHPAVELWLVCTARVGLNASCLHTAFSNSTGGPLAVNHTLTPAFDMPVASDFRFVLSHAAEPAALNATVTVSFSNYPPPHAGAARHAPAPAHVAALSTTRLATTRGPTAAPAHLSTSHPVHWCAWFLPGTIAVT